jgi:hypothetical protein
MFETLSILKAVCLAYMYAKIKKGDQSLQSGSKEGAGSTFGWRFEPGVSTRLSMEVELLLTADISLCVSARVYFLAQRGN